MKKRIIIGLIIVAALGAIVWGIIASGKKEPAPTIKATLGDITETILLTGTTKPVQSVDLSFERTGKVSAVYVSVGDRVRAGQLLVELEKADILAQLAQAQAAVDAAEAQLDQLKLPPRPEQIAVQEVAVANAQVTFNRAQQALFDALNDAYAKADDAARGKTDANFTNPRSATPILNFESIDPQYQIDLPVKKYAVENALIAWKSSLDSLAVGSGLLAAAAEGQDKLNTIKNYLDMLVAALNFVNPGSASNAAVWKVDAGLARAQVGTAISSLSAAETSLRNAQAALDLAKKNLDLQLVGSTPEQIAVQQAAVDQAKANVNGIRVSIGKTLLRSPIDGIITVQGAKLGQIVTVTTASAANTSLISIISEKKLEVDAFAPEVNVGRLAVGQPVKITFDALPGETFQGSIMEIDPAETIIDGVVNYKIKVALDSTDPRIKSGLTANLTIETAVKKGVVLLPQNAILQNDQGSFVRLVEGEKTREVSIELGIRGTDGNVEILSGIEAGWEVQNIGLKK